MKYPLSKPLGRHIYIENHPETSEVCLNSYFPCIVVYFTTISVSKTRCCASATDLTWVHSKHYDDVIMRTMASQITSLTSVYSILFRRRSKKTSKRRVTGLCEGNSQMVSNAENLSIWWRHHETLAMHSAALSTSNNLFPPTTQDIFREGNLAAINKKKAF